MHDRFDEPLQADRTITCARTAYFLLARPTEHVDRLPASIGERDVFFSAEEALDALDVHYGWCAARSGGFYNFVTSAQWYLQTAVVGPRLTPSLGEVYLATVDERTGDTQAAAGGFLTEGELIHWSPFLSAVRPRIPTSGSGDLELTYRGDTDVSFQHMWFAPVDSMRVYPKRIVLDENSTG